MSNKYYLDEEGLRRLVEFINEQHVPIAKAIELLNKTDGSPGSVKKMIDDAISELNLDNIEQKSTLYIYGGSASDMVN